MKKLLISGFEPFGGETMNPSWEAVSRLPDQIGEYTITKLRIPVEFDKAAQAVLDAAEQVAPDAILCIGQAGGRSVITPELVAINLRYAKIPDNGGLQPKDEPIVLGAPCAYFSTLPVRQMAEAIADAGVASQVSYSAGAYVCNDLLYTLLHRFHNTQTRVGFVHIPYAHEQGKEPSMDMADMIKGLTVAIESLQGEKQINKYNLRCGMFLYSKDGQTVQLASFSETHIRVVYKGKIHERPISVINEKLFFVKSCEKIILADSKKMQDSALNEQQGGVIDEKDKFNVQYNVPLTHIFPTAENSSVSNESEDKWVKSCRNCKFQVSGECSSWELCDDYQPAYAPPKSETDYYPKYGDATMFKKKSRKK